jgi:hypothetical protein
VGVDGQCGLLVGGRHAEQQPQNLLNAFMSFFGEEYIRAFTGYFFLRIFLNLSKFKISLNILIFIKGLAKLWHFKLHQISRFLP